MRVVILLSTAALLLAACRAEPTAAPEAPEGNVPTPQTAQAVPDVAGNVSGEVDFPKLEGRIVDRASLLSADQEAELTGELAALEARTNDQLVIVTVPSLGGRPIADYARELGNHWGIGQADRDNGVLLVVAPAERQTRIAVGHGLEPILTDDRAKEIIDRDLLPSFREERWHDGIQAGTRAIAAMLIANQGEPRRGRQ